MNDFLKRFEAALHQARLLGRGRKILVAVSGGVDSLVLLHALDSLAAKNRWRLFVAHFNHLLRGRASDEDARLVRRTAAELGLKFFPGHANVKLIAAKSKISVEMAARKLRHEFLARTAREHKISTIALAHHADDQVELFFLRLLRGAGSDGLAGMKGRSVSPADKGIDLVRPLLEFSKVELQAFARERQIRFRDDATNFRRDFLRNRVRNELLPLLRNKYQPGLDKIISRNMEIAAAEAEFIHQAARHALASSTSFDRLPPALQRKVLQLRLLDTGLLPDFDLVERLRRAAGKKISVSPGLTVTRNAAGKISCQEGISAAAFAPGQKKLAITGKRGAAEFAGRRFAWRLGPMRQFEVPPKSGARSRNQSEVFDADRIGHEIILRHWQPGDRFQPIGLKSPVKLQDLFVNAKIPGPQRHQLALATTGNGEIFWVEGLRIAEAFKLTPATKRKLVWSFAS